MAISKTLQIDGRDVRFTASAATPRLYYNLFNRDFFSDFMTLQNEYNGGGTLNRGTLELFENIAYAMAKQADPTVPDTADEWLDGFTMFGIYQIMPELQALWGLNSATHAESKKNPVPPTAR